MNNRSKVQMAQITQINHINLTFPCQKVLFTLHKNFPCKLITLLEASQRKNNFTKIHRINKVQQLPVNFPTIPRQNIVDLNPFSDIKLLILFVVKHLDDMSELVTERPHSGESCSDHGEGLMTGEGKHRRKFGFVVG